MPAETVSSKEHLLTLIEKVFSEQAAQGKFDLGTQTQTNIHVTLVSDPEDNPQFKFKIKINQEGRDDLDLFAKVTKVTPKWEKLVLKPFEKERLFYTSLMKTYRQLEDKHGLSEKDRLRLPACYGAETGHGNEILVLEDLSSRGFGLSNRFVTVSWAYAAAAVTELAKFHALSMTFQHESPNQFEKFTTQIPGGLFEKNEETDALIDMFKTGALKIVRSENKRKLNAFFRNSDFVTSLNDLLKPVNRQVILHGHFWPKNMMHKMSTDGSIEVIPLDYQTIQVGSPVTDLLHFIFTGTDAEFRENHYDELISHYCSELIKATARLGLILEQEYTSVAMTAELTEKLPYGLYSAVAYLFVLGTDDRAERAQGLPVDDETYRAAGLQLYYHRINEVTDDFVYLGLLQDQQGGSSRRCGICFIC